MTITKTNLCAFAHLAEGCADLRSLCRLLGCSISRGSEIATALANERLVVKQRDKKPGGSLDLSIAAAPHARALEELILAHPQTDFGMVLGSARLRLMLVACQDWKDRKTLSAQARVNAKNMLQLAKEALSRGMLMRKKSLFKVNDQGWPLLYRFLCEYRALSSHSKRTRWQLFDESLIETDGSVAVNGSPSGFARYADFGVPVRIANVLYYVPKRQLSKEEVFAHSLWEIKDSRGLYLALTFYVKNRLDQEQVRICAMRYDQLSRFKELIGLLDHRGDRPATARLPAFEADDFARVARLYGVKIVSQR